MLFYGDWGRHPNLKNQAPTPGIGLRRLLHAFPGILTVTVREWYTSSYCPCCQTSVEEARGKHALLRCCPGGVQHPEQGRVLAREPGHGPPAVPRVRADKKTVIPAFTSCGQSITQKGLTKTTVARSTSNRLCNIVKKTKQKSGRWLTRGVRTTK